MPRKAWPAGVTSLGPAFLFALPQGTVSKPSIAAITNISAQQVTALLRHLKIDGDNIHSVHEQKLRRKYVTRAGIKAVEDYIRANPEASLMTFGSQGANLAFSLQQIKGAGGGRYYLRGRLVRLFSRRKCLEGISVDMVDTINATIKRLHLMKVDSVKFEGKSWTSNWIRIYLQAHVRRALSLVESGLAEQRVGRTLTTALCSRSWIS